MRYGAVLSVVAALVTLTAARAASETSMPAPMRGTPGTQPPTPTTAPASTPWVRGKVLETMDVGSYTYVHIDTGSEKKWAAGPKTAVKVGDPIAYPGGATEMKNFESKSLGRKFESIAFVGALVVGDAPAVAKDPHAGLPTGIPKGIPMMGNGVDPHAGVPGMPPAAHGGSSANADSVTKVENIAKVEGGYTVGETHDKRSELETKTARVRGKVVKYNAGVMGKNWIHLRDGSTGLGGENDLTVTTDDQAKVGDTVVVTGRVGVNRDFGFGYRYDVILESATVVVEK